jgi:hypothetical protein
MMVVCFAVFTLIVNLGLVRVPFYARVGDAIVLPAVVAGLLIGFLPRAMRGTLRWRRWVSGVAGVAVLLVLARSLVVAGQSTERIHWVAGEWESWDRARGAWEEVGGRLWSSPPIDYWERRSPELTIHLAAYARQCLTDEDRILVLWFAPEIYYYADRLMAGRHLYYLPQLGGLVHERRMELDKIRRSPPRIVFARALSDRPIRAAFPDIARMLDDEYEVGGIVPAGDADDHVILVRKDRAPVREWGGDAWPCYQ